MVRRQQTTPSTTSGTVPRAPEASNPRPDEAPLLAEHLLALAQKRRELSAEFSSCVRELRQEDQNPLDDDLSLDSQNDELLASALVHLAREIREVDAAFARASDGRYGLCGDCGRRISVRRLRLNPTARRCLACQKKTEGTRH